MSSSKSSHLSLRLAGNIRAEKMTFPAVNLHFPAEKTREIMIPGTGAKKFVSLPAHHIPCYSHQMIIHILLPSGYST